MSQSIHHNPPAPPSFPKGAKSEFVLPHVKRSPYHLRAVIILTLTMILWGLSFPLMKGTFLVQSHYFPQVTLFFLSVVCIMFRFGVSALALALFSARSLKKMTRLELIQGIGLGIFAFGAMLFQFDGLNYTAASTSAFLTNCYVVLIPIFVAFQHKKLPPSLVFIACLLVIIGMGVLANLSFHNLQLGRGELETLIASLFFGALILWLERPLFRQNKTQHTSFVMYLVVALLGLPFLWFASHQSSPMAALSLAWQVCTPFSAFIMLLGLTFFCTVGGFTLMNHWQPHVEATEAGLIYCTEPLFGSAFAMFLPELISQFSGNVAHYPNEHLTMRLVMGGTFITLANVAMQLRSKKDVVEPVKVTA